MKRTNHSTNDLRVAQEVLVKAQDQLIQEIGRSALAVSRAQNYAPVLVSVSKALEVVDKLFDQSVLDDEQAPAPMTRRGRPVKELQPE